MRSAVAERAGPGVLVHLDDPGVALAVEGLEALTAFAPHNVEHRIVRDASRAGGAVRRAFGALDWRRLAAEERRLWREAGLCVAVSELDAVQMRSEGAGRVLICPNGADPRPAGPPRWRASDDPLNLLFVGSTSYEPYRHGLRWFIDEVLPLLRDRLDVRFTVVGGRPRDAREQPGVRYAGRVEDLAPWYAEAHVVVVPVFQGSGTRLKIPEAISFSRPVVSTALGAEGLPLRAGEHFLAGDDPESFAAALRQLATALAARSEDVTRMLDAARVACGELLWPRIADKLADSYAELGPESTVEAIRSTRSSRE
jgi:glycosyltransferase involved in cell wall biosynthesis